MRRGIGWWALAAVSGVILTLTVVGGAVALVAEFMDGDAGGALSVLGAVGVSVLFWRWILLGAWLRIRPPEGVDPTEADPVGPWGVVGRVMLGVLVIGFAGVSIWATVTTNEAVARAEEARDAGVRIARERKLTAADVARVQSMVSAVSWDAPEGSSGSELDELYDGLLEVPGAEVVAISADGDQASILLRVDGSPPCAVVDIVRGDLIRGRLTDDC